MRIKSLVFNSSSFHLIGALLVTSSLVSAEPKFRDAATGDDLLKKAKHSARHNPLGHLNPRVETEDKTADPTKENIPKDIIATSDFLSFSGMTTLIPKRSLLHVPENYQDRISFKQGNNLVIWPTFLRSNRGWIRAMEVTRAQAQGIEAFDEKVVENLAKSSVVVVATYKGGPISVLPYTDPDAAEEGADGESQPQN